MRKLLKSKPVFIILLLLGLLVAFLIGFYLAQNIFVQSYKEENTFNTFARYEMSRDIAKSLKNGDYKSAKCLADLEASDGFDYVKKCMADKQCAVYISKDVQERTPEILDGTSPSFDYLQRKGDIRRCVDD